MLFVGTSIIHPSTEGVFLLCNILDLLIYSCKISANATRMVKYITHCDVYFSKRKKVYITLDFGDKLSKRYCTQIRTYEFLQMLISETEAYQDLNIDTLF